MSEAMGESLRIFGALVVAIVPTLWVFVRYILPPLLTKTLEHAHNREMKHLEASLRSHSETLRASVDVGHSSVEQLRSRGIEAVETLWGEIRRVEGEFAALVGVESILTEKELSESVREGFSGNDEIRELLKEYSSIGQVLRKIEGGHDEGQRGPELAGSLGSSLGRLDRECLFVTEKLWRTYQAFIRLHGRLGILASRRMETGEAVSWRNDPHSRKIVEDVVPDDVWVAALKMQFSGFSGVTGFLKQQFILEAKRSMGGTDQFAETFKEYHRIMEEEEMDAREKRSLYEHNNK